jgi:hypothetical protein
MFDQDISVFALSYGVYTRNIWTKVWFHSLPIIRKVVSDEIDSARASRFLPVSDLSVTLAPWTA